MNSEIYHHGILGMKWGVRRTPEQLGHRKKAKVSKTSSKKTVTKKKSSSSSRLSDMSDDDLRKAISRLQLEKQYKDLTRQEVSAGKKWVMSVLNDSTKKVASNYLSKVMTQALDSAFASDKKKKDT